MCVCGGAECAVGAQMRHSSIFDCNRDKNKFLTVFRDNQEKEKQEIPYSLLKKTPGKPAPFYTMEECIFCVFLILSV